MNVDVLLLFSHLSTTHPHFFLPLFCFCYHFLPLAALLPTGAAPFCRVCHPTACTNEPNTTVPTGRPGHCSPIPLHNCSEDWLCLPSHIRRWFHTCTAPLNLSTQQLCGRCPWERKCSSQSDWTQSQCNLQISLSLNRKGQWEFTASECACRLASYIFCLGAKTKTFWSDTTDNLLLSVTCAEVQLWTLSGPDSSDSVLSSCVKTSN